MQVPCYLDLSKGLLCILMTWQLVFPRGSKPKEIKVDAAMCFMP